MGDNRLQIENYLERIADNMDVLAEEKKLKLIRKWADYRAAVLDGTAEKYCPVGDQLVTTWTDIATGIKYNVPLDVVAYADVTLESGEVVKGAYLQFHYATPFGISFDNCEAMRYAESEIAAGTYSFKIGTTWGSKDCIAEREYHFTLTKPVPAGGVIGGIYALPDNPYTSWRISTYAAVGDETPIETVSVESGAAGTSLGVLEAAGNENLNSIYRVGYGYNNYNQSAIRQWLNSDKGVGKWWEAKNNYDIRPDQLFTKAGFLTGFEPEFLRAIGRTQQGTKGNTVTDGGTVETCADKFFLPSLEQIYVKPQATAGDEGAYWPYWKQATGATEQQAQYGTYPRRITYGLDNVNAAQPVRLRSAPLGAAGYAWYVDASGSVPGNAAVGACRCAPACVIC